MFIAPASQITRLANTTTYGNGEVVGPSATAADCTPFKFSLAKMGRGNGRILGVRLYFSSTGVTEASFVVHFFTQAPTLTNGDNGAYAIADSRYWIDSLAIDLSSGAQIGTAGKMKRAGFSSAPVFDLSEHGQDARTIYAHLVTASSSGAYQPGSAETIRMWAEMSSE